VPPVAVDQHGRRAARFTENVVGTVEKDSGERLNTVGKLVETKEELRIVVFEPRVAVYRDRGGVKNFSRIFLVWVHM
jgi:hypothetical protein